MEHGLDADHGEVCSYRQEFPMVKKGATAVFAALLGMTLFGSVGFAQDASPAADCAATTADENILIVNDYFAAISAGDTAAADSLLHDDFTHDLSLEGVEVANEPGNADELGADQVAAAAESNVVIDATVASEDWVAVEFSFDVAGANVEGADAAATANVQAMAFLRIECGSIAEAHFEFDALGLLQQLGFEVTPPTP